jgi:GT2 family glycosyltransferase
MTGAPDADRKPRVLVVIPVYDGEDFVSRCVSSAARLDHRSSDIDVLVLDDCSPAPGWSERLAAHCAAVGAHYYRSPINLGIVRNFNLGFLTGVEDGYDYVLMANSDTILAHSLISALVAAAASDAAIGSVTAWGNNVSFCSIPNDCSEETLGDPEIVDWIGAQLVDEFGSAVLDVPAGTGFALLVPTRVLADIGYLDNVFDRGYCEETDWTQRSIASGYRAVLGLGAFAYHIGSASTQAAGLIRPMETSISAHEAIIDLRYPHFRDEVNAFVAGDAISTLGTRAVRRLIDSAISTWGYVLDLSGATAATAPTAGPPTCWWDLDDPAQMHVSFRGFRQAYELPRGELIDALRATFDRPPF